MGVAGRNAQVLAKHAKAGELRQPQRSYQAADVADVLQRGRVRAIDLIAATSLWGPGGRG